ncbi:MAG TPA: hypothetical protein VF192_01135 [Longimicrobiales bacterium]
MTARYVDEAEAIKRVRRIAGPEASASFERWLKEQRTAPQLISATRSAQLLGVKPPHISRLKDQGRMPEPIPVEGGNDAYVLEEVEALAKVLHAEREERARRKEARNGSS